MSPESQQAVVQKYGEERVRQAVQFKMETLQSEVMQTNRKVQGLQKEISTEAKWSFNLAVAKTLISLGSAAVRTGEGVSKVTASDWKDWKPFFTDTRDQVVKAGTSAVLTDRNMKVISDAATDPIRSTVNSSLHIAMAVVDDQLRGAEGRQTMLADQAAQKSLEYRNFNNLRINLLSTPSGVPRIEPAHAGSRIEPSRAPTIPSPYSSSSGGGGRSVPELRPSTPL
jgi:hypothetical protein